MRSVRNRADELRLDYSHFRGERRWTEAELRRAVSDSDTWLGVAESLGLKNSFAVATIKGHARRLGLDSSHLSGEPATPAPDRDAHPDVRRNLGSAGALLAAAWFKLCGFDVSWPLEPCRYDLLVASGSEISRVQVKTTTVQVGTTWQVFLSACRGERRTYDPDEIDEFFIIDGRLTYYLIPIRVVGGLQAIHLSAYEQYRLPSAA